MSFAEWFRAWEMIDEEQSMYRTEFKGLDSRPSFNGHGQLSCLLAPVTSSIKKGESLTL